MSNVEKIIVSDLSPYSYLCSPTILRLFCVERAGVDLKDSKRERIKEERASGPQFINNNTASPQNNVTHIDGHVTGFSGFPNLTPKLCLNTMYMDDRTSTAQPIPSSRTHRFRHNSLYSTLP